MSAATAQVPPQNVEAEKSVLGAMLVSDQAVTAALAAGLVADDFYLDRHRILFEAIGALHGTAKPVDELSIANELAHRRQLEAIGDKDYIAELAATVPAAGNAKHYAEIVREHATLRRLLEAGQEIQGWVHDRNGADPADLQRRAAELIASVGPGAGELSAALQAPADALATAAVDLIEVLRNGIPDPAYVPGGEPWLRAGKRYLMPAPAGTGKSLAALVICLATVEHGGTAAILDVENGSDEYARRLANVLEAGDGADGALADACRERLRYYEWPRLSMTWGPQEWAEALAGVDLAIFDSSRLVLSAAGLAEDSNDDYSVFVSALLVPLARAGTTTLVLDNTGHEERERPRGASAKSDLNEVVYGLKVGQEFDREHRGHLRLIRRRQRFAGLPAELHIPIGGGVYGPVEIAAQETPEFRPTTLMERLSEAIELDPGMGRKEVREAIKGKNDAKDLALRLLVGEDYVRVEQDGQAKRHYGVKLYRASEDPRVEAEDA